MVLKKRELKNVIIVLAVILGVIGIILVGSLVLNIKWKSKAGEYDQLNKEHQLCLGNLSEKINELADVERKKNILINALQSDKKTLNKEMENLRLELENCQKSLVDVNNSVKGKEKTIQDLQNRLVKCQNYSDVLAKLENDLGICNKSLNEARKFKDSDLINFFGLFVSVVSVEVIEIVSVLVFFLSLSFLFSVKLKWPSKLVFSWVLASLITAIVALILEINSITLPLMPNLVWYFIIFTVLFSLFGLAFKRR